MPSKVGSAKAGSVKAGSGARKGQTSTLNHNVALVGRLLAPGNSIEIVVALFTLVAVGMMIIPLPTWLLDLLLTANLSLSILLLFAVLFMRGGLSLSSFPTTLLLITLFRLALNVSSTRLILLQASAGDVIGAFGTFVVQGNYVVGGVVFLILTIVQYLVIAKGSERVAEVGARFTLDALPGKQMSIDGLLRAKSITPRQAKIMRDELDRESQFFGAMDGAMKFVKGDAIAGMVIIGINLVGGVAIGIGTEEREALETLEVYGLLTIGDGLISQIPALLISTSAGLLVTRVHGYDEDSSLGSHVLTQFLQSPRALAATAFVLLLLAVVPQLPGLPFATVGAALLYGAWRKKRRIEKSASPLVQETETQTPSPPSSALTLYLGSAYNTIDTRQLRTYLARGYREKWGAPFPILHLVPSAEIAPNEWRISFRQRLLCEEKVEDNPSTDSLATSVGNSLSPFAAELLSVEHVQTLIDELSESEPALLKLAIPDKLSLLELKQILQQLLTQGIPIHSLDLIIEFLATSPQGEIWERAESLRKILGRTILEPLLSGNELKAFMLSPESQELLESYTSKNAKEPKLALPYQLARETVENLSKQLEEHGPLQSPLIVPSSLRPQLHTLLKARLPNIIVLSEDEIRSGIEIQVLGYLDAMRA